MKNFCLYGAIIGDIVGSKYEFHNIKTKDFPFLSAGCSYTDDTIMTIAVANALLAWSGYDNTFPSKLIQEMQRLGRKYPYPQGGYGGRFSAWLRSDDPQPYNSLGNGSAMRVSPCALFAVSLEEALRLAEISASVTHNHPEGIHGAKAVAAAIFLASKKVSKDRIKKYLELNFYPLSQPLDEIRKTYVFNEICRDTVPQAIIAFLESESFEDAIRNAVSIGGDSDTIAAITGSIAWAYYYDHDHMPSESLDPINALLPQEFIETIETFERHRLGRLGTCFRQLHPLDYDEWYNPLLPLGI